MASGCLCYITLFPKIPLTRIYVFKKVNQSTEQQLDFIVIRFLLYNYYIRETQMTNFMTLFILTLLWKVNV